MSWKFGLIAFISHLFIDGCTSRISSNYWKKDERHNFWLTIGFDQMLHQIVILLFVYFM